MAPQRPVESEPFENLAPASVKERLDEGWVYVDVRTPPEFDDGHPPGAYNVPIAFPGKMGMELNEHFVDVFQRLFKRETKLVLGCKSGPRSMHACRFLADAGFLHLVNLDGGFHGVVGFDGTVHQHGWKDLGLPVELETLDGRSWDELEDDGA